MDQLSSVLSNNNNIHLNTNFELLEPFEGVQPNLISKKILNEIENKINTPIINNNYVIKGIGSFYNEYILPNMFPLIMLSILCIYLVIKYILKKDKEQKKQKKQVKQNVQNMSDLISDDYLLTDIDT